MELVYEANTTQQDNDRSHHIRSFVRWDKNGWLDFHTTYFTLFLLFLFYKYIFIELRVQQFTVNTNIPQAMISTSTQFHIKTNYTELLITVKVPEAIQIEEERNKSELNSIITKIVCLY